MGSLTVDLFRCPDVFSFCLATGKPVAGRTGPELQPREIKMVRRAASEFMARSVSSRPASWVWGHCHHLEIWPGRSVRGLWLSGRGAGSLPLQGLQPGLESVGLLTKAHLPVQMVLVVGPGAAPGLCGVRVSVFVVWTLA